MLKFNQKYTPIILNLVYILVISLLLILFVWLNNDVGFMKGSNYMIVAVQALILILGIYIIKFLYTIIKIILFKIKSRK